MYKKNLYIIPPLGGKTRFLVPEIVKKEKENGKTVLWLTEDDNIEYCGLQKENIASVFVEEWKSHSFMDGDTYQILCSATKCQKEPLELILSMADKMNVSIIIDAAASIIGYGINRILCQKIVADIHLLYDDLSQAYVCISQNNPKNLEYSEKKYLDTCRKEYNTFENKRIFWMEHMGVEKIKMKKRDATDTPKKRPLPTYQPYSIFGCTLFHYKQGCLPGMTIEEMVDAVKSSKTTPLKET